MAESSAPATNLIAAYFAIWCLYLFTIFKDHYLIRSTPSFPTFTYYVTTLSCTIGRRSVPNGGGLDTVPVHVDIDLGPLKSVSRLHARIEYDEDVDGFIICVLGRNGAWVDGVWAKSGSRVPLGQRTNIQIASRTFQFLLASPSSSSHSHSHSQDQSQTDSGVAQSPASSSALEIVSSPNASPHIPLRDVAVSVSSTVPDGPPPIPLATLCCRAIEASGGKATLSQIRRWLAVQYEWYRISEGWQPSVRQLLNSDPIFYKARRDKSQKGKDSLYSFRSPKASNKASTSSPSASKPKNPPPTTVVELETEADVYVDDPPPPAAVLSSSTGKRPAGKGSSSRPSPPPARPAKRQKMAQKMPRRSLTDSLLPPNSGSGSPSTSIPTPAPTPTPTPVPPPVPLDPVKVEERRKARRRAELESKIQTALQERLASIPPAEHGRIVCIPIRISSSPPVVDPARSSSSSSTTTTTQQQQQPLALLNGEIVLSAKLFAHVASEQLLMLRRLETPKVLEILRAEIKKSLVEEYRANKAKANKPGPSAGAAASTGTGASATQNPKPVVAATG